MWQFVFFRKRLPIKAAFAYPKAEQTYHVIFFVAFLKPAKPLPGYQPE
jgi:hypothetical protein